MKITVFTPTYNRKQKLNKLYESLLKQTNKNFEWIIVDDGSKDNTMKDVELWKKDNIIDIKYFYQENAGKMIAHNKGVKEASGELFVCVDSDDILINNAIELINIYSEKIKNKKYIGIVTYKVLMNGNLVGNGFPTDIESATLVNLYQKYKFKGDTMLIYKTNLVEKFEFKVVNNEKFIPETYLYDKLDQLGELYLMREKIYVCEYLEDGYTANSANIIKNNPNSYALMANERLKIYSSFKICFRAGSQYVLGMYLAKRKGIIKNANKKIYAVLGILPAIYMYLKKYK